MTEERTAVAWTINSLLRDGDRRLGRVSLSPRLDAELLLAHALGCSREQLYRTLFNAVPVEVVTRFEELLVERAGYRPVAQLTGRREFWSLTLMVTPATLVPRPETELLVERILALLPAEPVQHVLDLGTGSGAIALAVARERPHWRLVATDLSKRALAVARRNADELGIGNVTFRHGHWLRPVAGMNFDAIVSNPPYVATGELENGKPELAFEPRRALVAGLDGLDAIREIAARAPAHLVTGGPLLVEHGPSQGEAVRLLFRKAGFTAIQNFPDLAGLSRVTEGHRAPAA